MLERKLTPWQRALQALAAVVGVVFIGFVLYGLFMGTPLPWIGRTIMWFAVGGFAMTSTLAAWSAISGRWRRRPHSQLALFASGVMLAGMALVFLRTGAEDGAQPHSIMLQTTGWVFLGLLAVTVLMHYMEEQQLKTQAKLLELELRLAQIAERLDRS